MALTFTRAIRGRRLAVTPTRTYLIIAPEREGDAWRLIIRRRPVAAVGAGVVADDDGRALADGYHVSAARCEAVADAYERVGDTCGRGHGRYAAAIAACGPDPI